MTTVTAGQPNAEGGPAGRAPAVLTGPPEPHGYDTVVGTARATPEPVRLRITVPADPSWASALRRLVTAQLVRLPLSADRCDTAVLAMDELFANAVTHASDGPRDSITLTVEWSDGTLRVTVADSSPVLPQRRTAGTAAESGRGLAIVDALADDWGMSPPEAGCRGKRVWFVLREGRTR
ncbi:MULTISPECIES: ATP-binding protein [Streptomyces]|uniref:ATP-binding protein n=1 Tax=Streptomyces TaxID=1883 RepID=UPI000F739764|nr:ATP-binding protein [Streptomyces sp. WAC00469]RSS05293.1 ATP-binding protein [Streptomyces sp. WAC00469]